jgi:tyrosine-protein kinase Etk/Wzc
MTAPRSRRLTPVMAESRLHLWDLLQVLFVHIKVVVGVTAVVLGATWLTGRRALPRYESRATIQVNSNRQPLARLESQSGIEDLALRTDPVLSEALVLSTQQLGATVSDVVGLRAQFSGTHRAQLVYNVQVDSLARTDSFELRMRGARGWELHDGSGRAMAAGGYDAPVVGPGFTFMVHANMGAPVVARFAIIPRDAAANMVRGGLGYTIQPNTNLVEVTYTGGDSSVVDGVLNAAMQALREYGVLRTRELAEGRLQYITARADEARQRYLASLTAMQAYKEHEHTSDLTAEETALINSIQEYDRERSRRQLDLATIRSIMAGSQDVTLETVNRLAAVAAISTNPAMGFQLDNLLKLYDARRTMMAGDNGMREANPQVQAIDQRIAQTSRALVDATQATIRSLESGLGSLESNIRDLRGQLASYPGKQSQYAQHALETELENETYKYLLSQEEAARISAAAIAPYVQIVERGSPAGRIGMGLRPRMTMGLIIGLFLAVVTAFFLEYLDQTIKTSSDVARALEIPVLGLIPQEAPPQAFATTGNGRMGRRHNLPLVSLLSPDDPASEAYRTLRTNVTFVNAEQQQLQVIVITSPGPGEGKSTTAANLAITLAQLGTRTLLVDADLRRPLMHRAFNLVQEPGLTDVLVGTATVREAVRPNVVPNLDVLPAGALPPNPSELLGSVTMQRLVEELRGTYATIIFDSPPTLAVTDATVLGAAADAVILVVRAGETDEVAAQRALAQLKRVRARVAGTVLNGIRKDRDRYYNYYSYYRNDRTAKGGRGGGPFAALKARFANVL